MSVPVILCRRLPWCTRPTRGSWTSRSAVPAGRHFFGGFTYDEIAELLEVSASTVRADLRLAKAWLASRLGDLR